MNFKIVIGFCFFSLLMFNATGQNLVVDGHIGGSNTIWGGGVSEAPYNNSTYENIYLTTGCSSNYIMEADYESQPQQTVSGFLSGAQYIVMLRCAWRNTGCNASSSPTTLNVQFTDAPSVLNWNISVPNTQTSLTTVRWVISNNTSSTHTLKFTNPGNTNTCGVIIDDISIVRVASPGGVGTANLTAWMNATNLRLTDNSSINGWMNLGSALFCLTPSCGNAPVYKTGLTPGTEIIANYNPYITFNGSSQYLQFINSKVTLANLAATGAGATYFSVNQGGSSARSLFAHQSSANSRLDAKTNSCTFSSSTSTGTNNNAVHTNLTKNNILSYSGKDDGLIIRDQNGSSLTRANASANVDFITMGVLRNTSGTYSNYFNGSMSEVILFNTVLTATQAQQIRSYLATKYGVTLSNNSTTAGIDERDYRASNGTTLYWNYTNNSTYHTNVTVIGRDDNTALNKKISISTDPDINSNTNKAMLTIEQAGDFSSNLSYFAAGHNGIAANLADFIDVPPLIKSRLRRIWKYQKTGTGVSNFVTVTFDMTGYTPLTGTDLRLLVSTSSGFTTSLVISGSYAGTNFTATLPTTAGVYFTVGSSSFSTPLPIELINFDAELNGDVVDLDWTTASEINNDFFTIEKSKNGIDFEWVKNIKGAGNSTSNLKYATVDPHPLDGVSYYRLKQTDFDGYYTYSSLRKIIYNKKYDFSFTIAYNTENSNSITLNIHSADESRIQINVVDMTGKLCFSKEIYPTHNTVTEQLDFNFPLANGMYCVILKMDEQILTKKLFVR